MAFDFPSSPTVNQLYPASVTPGQPQYKWDGEKWVSTAASSPLLTVGGQTISGGFNLTPNNLGNIPAAFTPNPLLGNYQYGTNHNAATWSAPASDCAMDILVTNDASAGAITFSGYTVGAFTGDPVTTTSGNRFIVSIRRINAISTYTIKALQ
jgi:hypothetical protein